MIDTPVKRSSSPISPRAARIAMRAETAVPVGERSSLPGWIATTDCARKAVPSRVIGPAKRQNE